MFLNCSLADSSIAMSCRFIIHFQHGGVQTQSNMYFGLCYYTPYPFYPSTVTATAVFFEHDLTQHPVRVDSTIATSWFEYLVLTGCLGMSRFQNLISPSHLLEPPWLYAMDKTQEAVSMLCPDVNIFCQLICMSLQWLVDMQTSIGT